MVFPIHPLADDLLESRGVNRIFVVGGGIVGASLAYFLSKERSQREIVVIDKSLDALIGSTGHAPGFVGQLNESPTLTNLAKETMAEYLNVPNGFCAVGGLELASKATSVEMLLRRQKLAQAAGLAAKILTAEEAVVRAPDFIRPDSVHAGLLFPADGTANALAITAYYVEQAQKAGVRFVQATVTGFASAGENVVTMHCVDGDVLLDERSTVVLATGIWTAPLVGTLLQQPLPIIPVAHPYTFSGPRPPRHGTQYPFVRWLDHHVYARDHGARDGFGTYDHLPLQVSPGPTAIGAWPSSFKQALSDAALHLKNGAQFQTTPDEEGAHDHAAFNGIFAVTPDNLPLAGKVAGLTNLWLCAAVWVTTAAGTAKVVARQIVGRGVEGDAELLLHLSPDRFRGLDAEELRLRALGMYNDIYNSNLAS